MSELSINTSWLPGYASGSGPVPATEAEIGIVCSGRVLTHIDDSWSKSVRDVARISAYPMALWLAASWWRLRWEARPKRENLDLSWRMSHELPAAGHGYTWPAISFESDGESIGIRSRPSDGPHEPVRYLTAFDSWIDTASFEREVDAFVELVLARLDATKVREEQLCSLWRELRQERTDPQASNVRRLEARLGFDPDEAPEELLDRVDKLASRAGEVAAGEISIACAGPNAQHGIQEVEDFAGSAGIDAHIRPNAVAAPDPAATPGQRGFELARNARRAWGLGTGPVSNETLGELLGIGVGAFRDPASGGRVALAIRHGRPDHAKLLFRKRNEPGLRFEGARFLAAHITASDSDRWLAATDAFTARQKEQRGFAAELLCPIESLDDRLKGDYSESAMEDAADAFNVSERVVASHLANREKIPREWANFD